MDVFKPLIFLFCTLCFDIILGQAPCLVTIDMNDSSIEVRVQKEAQEIYQSEIKDSADIDSLAKSFHQYWTSNHPEHTSWLMYVHSLYGGSLIYHDIAISTLQNSFTDSLDMPLFIIEWGSWNPLYGKNQEIAYQKGKTLARILRPFLADSINIHSLHHSMGSRVLEGMISEMQEGESLSQVYLVAPDLDKDFLQKDSALIAHHINDLHIFYSQNDLVLVLAEILNQEKRLGNMSGTNGPDNLHLYDTRELDCVLNNNHINWLTCKEVREIIMSNLLSVSSAGQEH